VTPPPPPPSPARDSGRDPGANLLLRAAHDLRQPFQAMRLFLHLLEARLDSAETLELAGKLSRSLQAGEAQIAALLDYAQLQAMPEAPATEEIALQPLLLRLGDEFGATAAEAGLRLRLVATSARTRSDARLLERALRALVANALAYTARGGVVIGVRRRGPQLRIEVRDSGRGVPEALRASLLQPFVRGPASRDGQQGLGLGLAIAERATALLGHRLGFTTTAERGSCFWIEVPAMAAQRTAPPASPAAIAVPADRIVAVAEDDALQLAALCSMLREWGWDPVAARSARQVMAELERRGNPPQLIITDYRLQGGKSGADLIAGIRTAFGGTIPALVLTGQSNADLDQAVSAGRLELITKPFNPLRLRQKLDALARR
jgi:CheY-like chemotaxis protein/anti-sigma regulatory factor (Ser/Thr protein kinase)